MKKQIHLLSKGLFISPLFVLVASWTASAADPNVTIQGVGAQELIQAFANFQDSKVPGVTYEPTSTQAQRPASGSYEGRVFIDCTDAVSEANPATCTITLLEN